MRLRSISVIVLGLVSLGSAQNCGKLAALPKANPSLHRDILDADQWLNPFLHVNAQGIEIANRDGSRDDRALPLDELLKKLSELPSSKWPFGGIVAISSGGPMAIGTGPLIDQKRRDLEKALGKCGIAVEPWP